MTDLADRLGKDLAAAWRPDQEDADILIGKIVSIDVGTSDFDPYPLLVIEQDDGEEKAVHAFHTVLKNELLKQKPQIGERIGIKYLGEVATKPGSKFKSFIGYRVKVERAAGATFDWGSINAEPELEAASTTTQEPVTVPEDAQEDGIPF